jgi:hypothetical protein
MSSTKLSGMLLIVICTLGVFVTSARAQLGTIDMKVYFTFSGPVEIPGATLPAGKYLFHLADPTSGRQVLQVQSADGKRVHGMFFSMPVQRPSPPNDAEVRFMETASGSPAVISTLWYAGEQTGRELIYPREQALRIAKTTNVPVLTTKSNTAKAEDAKTGELTRVSSSGQETNVAANASAAEPGGRLQRNDAPVAETMPAARAATPVATAGQTSTQSGRATPARSSLPETAGNAPFMLMLGVGLFTVTVALRLSRTGWM